MEIAKLYFNVDDPLRCHKKKIEDVKYGNIIFIQLSNQSKLTSYFFQQFFLSFNSIFFSLLSTLRLHSSEAVLFVFHELFPLLICETFCFYDMYKSYASLITVVILSIPVPYPVLDHPLTIQLGTEAFYEGFMRILSVCCRYHSYNIREK